MKRFVAKTLPVHFVRPFSDHFFTVVGRSSATPASAALNKKSFDHILHGSNIAPASTTAPIGLQKAQKCSNPKHGSQQQKNGKGVLIRGYSLGHLGPYSPLWPYRAHMGPYLGRAGPRPRRPTDRPTDRPTVRSTDRPTDLPSDRPTVRLSDRPSDRPTVRPSDLHRLDSIA